MKSHRGRSSFSACPLVSASALRTRFLSALLLSSTAAFLASPQLACAQAVWKGEGQGFFANDWVELFNWVGNTPPDTATGYTPLTVSFVSPLYQGGDVSNIDSFFGSYNAAGLRFNLHPDPVLDPGVPSVFTLSASPGVQLTINGGPLTNQNNIVNLSSAEVRVSAPLQGSADLYQRGTGRMVLSGANGYQNTFIDQGVLSISSDGNLGQPLGRVTFSGTGRLESTADLVSPSRTFALALNRSPGTPNQITLSPAAGTTLTLGIDGAGGDVTNPIAFSGDWRITGGGTVRPTSRNQTFYGPVLVDGATLQFVTPVAQETALRSAPVSLSNGGQLEALSPGLIPARLSLGELNATPGTSFRMAAPGVQNAATIFTLGEGSSSAQTYLGHGELTIAGPGKQVFSGLFLESGGAQLSVQSGTRVTLEGASSLMAFNQALVRGGTLVVNNEAAITPRLPVPGTTKLVQGRLEIENGPEATTLSIGAGGSAVTVSGPNASLSLQGLDRPTLSAGTLDVDGPITWNSGAVSNGIIGTGWATFGKNDWATLTPVQGSPGTLQIGALAPGDYAAATGVLQSTQPNPFQNVWLTGSGQLTLIEGVRYNTLKIESTGVADSLDITTPYVAPDRGSISTNAVLLTGSHDYTIQNTTANGTGVLSALVPGGDLILNVSDEDRTLNVKTDLQAGRVIKAGAGTLNLDRSLFGPANTFLGNAIEFRVNEGILRGVADGNLLYPTTLPLDSSSFSLRGGQVEFVGGPLGYSIVLGLGTGPGTVNWTGGDVGDAGSGGFSARTGDIDLALSGVAVWGQGSFVSDNQALVFGSATSDAALNVHFTSGLSLGLATERYEMREIRVLDNEASDKDGTMITGGISGDRWKDLVKTGSGTLALAGNSYQGGTIIAEGKVLALDAHALGATQSEGNSAARYVLLGARAGSADASLVIASDGVALDRDIVAQAGSTGEKTLGFEDLGTASFTGRINLKDTVTARVDKQTGRLVLGGGVDSEILGEGGLTKKGAGTLELLAANSYSGTTRVEQGRLLVNNLTGSATGSGNVEVKSGAVLGGSGHIDGFVTVDAGGILAPGNSPGELSIGGSLDASFSTLKWELANVGVPAAFGTGLSASSGYDFLRVDGDIDLSYAKFQAIGLAGFGLGFDASREYSWKVAETLNGAINITGVTYDLSQFSLAATYPGDFALVVHGKDLYFEFAPIPEPAWSAGLIGLAACLAALRRRRTLERIR